MHILCLRDNLFTHTNFSQGHAFLVNSEHFAEQLRISAAQMVLDQRGFESPKAVGKLPDAEQRAVVASILQRELGIMVLGALVNVVLLARAAMTHG